MIRENENSTPYKDNYILYSGNDITEFSSYEDAVSAYRSCSGAKFLYQPDKRYFFVTLSSTGYNYGKRDTVKAYGLFIAKNVNQIKRFLATDVDWRVFGGYRAQYSKFRVYSGGYGSEPICSDTDFDKFNYYVNRNIRIIDPSYYLEKDFGAVSVTSTPSGIERDIPFGTIGG